MIVIRKAFKSCPTLKFVIEKIIEIVSDPIYSFITIYFFILLIILIIFHLIF